MLFELIDAIGRFETLLKSANEGKSLPMPEATARVRQFLEAESELRRRLIEFAEPTHGDICEPAAEGCTEGYAYNGTIYAPGFSAAGHPVVIVMRRVTDLSRSGALLGLAEAASN